MKAPRKQAASTVVKNEENVAALFGNDDFSNPVEETATLIPFDSDVSEDVNLDEVPKVEIEEAEEKEPELTQEQKDEYLAIFDSIMFEGSYREVSQLGKRYKVCLRSRSAGEDMLIAQRLDTMSFKTLLAYQNQSALLTLAHSLVYFCNDDLSQMTVKDRYEYVSKLSSGIVPMISEILVKFDAKISAAMEYGKENF